MQRKNSGIVLVATLALAFAASPALAQKGGGDGGGGGAAAGGGGGGGGGGGKGGGGGMAAPAASPPASSKMGGGGMAGPAAGARGMKSGGANFSGRVTGGGRFAGGGYRRGGGYAGRRHFRNYGGGFGYGFGSGAYAAAPYGYYDDSYPYYQNEPVYEIAPQGGDGDQYCRQRYRSYDPASRTYLGFDGIRHPCP